MSSRPSRKRETPIAIRVLRKGDEDVLSRVAPHVFDNPIDGALTSEFLTDARHHLVVAIENDFVVGFASAVHYVHPDKRAELWINEVGVAPTLRRQGVAHSLLRALFDIGRSLGCGQAWVLSDLNNSPAVGLYQSLGGRAAPCDTVMYEFPL